MISPKSARRSMIFAAVATLATAALTVVAQPQPAATTRAAVGEKIVTPSGLTIIERGMSDLAVQEGDTVTCHYTGKLDDGTVFDSSVRRNEPFTFTLGKTGVIKGWAEGIVGMKAGQKRTLIIPADLGYGDAGSPPAIPGGATLTFELEVLHIARPAAADAPRGS